MPSSVLRKRRKAVTQPRKCQAVTSSGKRCQRPPNIRLADGRYVCSQHYVKGVFSGPYVPAIGNVVRKKRKK